MRNKIKKHEYTFILRNNKKKLLDINSINLFFINKLNCH